MCKCPLGRRKRPKFDWLEPLYRCGGIGAPYGFQIVRTCIMNTCIVGWAHTPFGRLEGESVESLIVQVATEALADARIAPGDVDEVVLGHFNAGFSAQDFTASLVLQAAPELRFKSATRVENACATGSAAVQQGLKAIAAGSARIVLCVGAEQMTTTPSEEVGR